MTDGTTDGLGDVDSIELGQRAAADPADGDVAAEMMARSLTDTPLVEGVVRRDGNMVCFVQQANGPALRNWGKDYDYDLKHIAAVGEADSDKLPEYDEEYGEIAVMVRVRGVREDFEGYARPDYSSGLGEASYKGDGDTPRPA